MRILIHWLISTVCLLLVCFFVPGISVNSFVTALIAAAVIGLLNVTIGLLLKIVTFPLTILTLGLFILVINALMLIWASHIVSGFQVRSFGAAFIGALILAVLHMLMSALTDRA